MNSLSLRERDAPALSLSKGEGAPLYIQKRMDAALSLLPVKGMDLFDTL